jgi:hypothetical protein
MCSMMEILNIERKKVGAALMRDKADPRCCGGQAILQAWFGHCAPDQSGGAYPRRLSRGATSRRCLVPVRTPEGERPVEPPSNPQSAKPWSGEAIEETGGGPLVEFPAAVSAGGQPPRRRRLGRPGDRRQAESIRTQNEHYIGASNRLGKVFPSLLLPSHSAAGSGRI